VIEATISVKPPHTWIRSIAESYPARIRILDCKASESDEGVTEVFEILTDDEHSDRILDALQQDSYIDTLDIISSKGGRILGTVTTHRCTACRTFAVSHCFLVSVSANKDGTVEWVLLGSEDEYKRLLRSLGEQGVEATVTKLTRATGGKSLTSRQEQILQIALEKGYFNYPRSIDLRSLAQLLDVSPPTLSELLRKAQRKILQEHFRGRISALSRQSRV